MEVVSSFFDLWGEYLKLWLVTFVSLIHWRATTLDIVDKFLTDRSQLLLALGIYLLHPILALPFAPLPLPWAALFRPPFGLVSIVEKKIALVTLTNTTAMPIYTPPLKFSPDSGSERFLISPRPSQESPRRRSQWPQSCCAVAPAPRRRRICLAGPSPPSTAGQ